MQNIIFLLLANFLFIEVKALDYELVSQDLLYSVRAEEDASILIQQLENVSIQDLSFSLNTEAKKKAFWLNIYNAFIQIKAKENPSMIAESRKDFFTNDWIRIAGEDLSFDDMEHGILRRSQWKFGMGYISKWFPNSFEKAFRVAELDNRIHFALNCGASGCPPIAFYTAAKIDEQLDLATQGFLQLNTSFDWNKNTVEVSKILSWFKGDFAGRSGILKLLKSYNLIPNGAYPKLSYKEYDWTLSLSNYIE